MANTRQTIIERGYTRMDTNYDSPNPKGQGVLLVCANGTKECALLEMYMVQQALAKVEGRTP